MVIQRTGRSVFRISTGNREQRRAQARAQGQHKKEMDKIVATKKTPAKARQGCLGCLTIIGIILVVALTISGLIDINKNKDKDDKPAKKPTATEKKR